MFTDFYDSNCYSIMAVVAIVVVVAIMAIVVVVVVVVVVAIVVFLDFQHSTVCDHLLDLDLNGVNHDVNQNIQIQTNALHFFFYFEL